MEQINEFKNSAETGEFKKENNSFRLFKIIKGYIILFFFTSILETLILRFIPPAYTPLMIMRALEELADYRPPAFSYQYKPLSNISDKMKLAVIASEDQNFPNHFGVDFKEIQKAYKSTKKKGRKKLRGASTISQQVAKNVFLIPSRSFIRKGLELYYTLLIEVFWGKKKILETYLNVAEMGEGIYGAEAASKRYFKKPSLKLTKSESASLAAVLPSPRKYSVKNPSSYILKRRSWIRNQMNSLGNRYLEKL